MVHKINVNITNKTVVKQNKYMIRKKIAEVIENLKKGNPTWTMTRTHDLQTFCYIMEAKGLPIPFILSAFTCERGGSVQHNTTNSSLPCSRDYYFLAKVLKKINVEKKTNGGL